MFHAYPEKPPVRKRAEPALKRKRHEVEGLEEHREYAVDTYRERGISESSSTAPSCGSPVWRSLSFDDLLPEDLDRQDTFILDVPPRASGPSEAMMLSIIERDLQLLAIAGGRSDNTEARPRASAFLCRSTPERLPLAEVSLPAASSHRDTRADKGKVRP